MSGGGGSSGSTQPTQTNVTQTNIPQYAQPYVESMLGATQQQLFNTQQTGGTPGYWKPSANTSGTGEASPFASSNGSNSNGEWVPGTPGTTEITGIKPYQPYSNNPQDYVAGFSPMQQQSFNQIQNMQVAPQIGQATNYANTATQGALDSANIALGYGSQGQASGLTGQQLGVQGGGYYGGKAAGLAGANIGTGMAGMQAGMSYGQNATNPNAVQAYMNPYLQASLAPQQQLLNQQFGIQNAANQGQATQQGAFGGGRQAIMQGLNQQNQDLATNQLVSQGYNNAYNVANQNMQNAASLGMQGAGVGLQGLQGANAAYNTGLQGVNTQLAGTAQGMQGAQIGLQGVAGAQAGYGLGLQGANTLGQLGTNQYNQQMGINQAQLQAGSLQQQQQQNIVNQGIQNYNTAQQYPQQQLAFMNSMLRGLPMSSQTTQQYAAAPSLTSQAAGLGLAGAGAYQMLKAEGGMIKEKKFAAGGIASGVPAGKLDSMLGRLSDQQLQQKALMPQNDPDTAAAAMGQQAFREQMRNPGIGAAPATSMNQLAGGGIVAFADGGDTDEGGDTDKTTKLKDYMAERQSILGPNTSGADYLKTLQDLQGKSEEGRGAQMGSRLLQTGLGILGGTSPYAAVNVGQGAKEGIAGMMEDKKAQKAEEMAMAKAQYDVNRMDYTDKAKLLEEAAKDYEGLLNRASKEGISKAEIDAKIKVAGMEVGGRTEAARLLNERSIANAKTAHDKAIEIENMKENNGTVNKLYLAAEKTFREANPNKEPTAAQKELWLTNAVQNAKPNIAGEESAATRTQIAIDKAIQDKMFSAQLFGVPPEKYTPTQKEAFDKIRAEVYTAYGKTPPLMGSTGGGKSGKSGAGDVDSSNPLLK